MPNKVRPDRVGNLEHLVVKAEREDGRGRLHIDTAVLREWRIRPLP
jgi:hypothetical protein